MKVLLTLDFPPQRGGIQNYLSGIVDHEYSTHDLVMTFAVDNVDEKYYSPRFISFKRFRLLKNPKLSILKSLFTIIKLRLKYKSKLNIFCGNIYPSLIPWLLHIPYCVYTYGTEIIALQKPKSLWTLLLQRVLRDANTLITISLFTKKMLKASGCHRKIVLYSPRIDLPIIPIVKKTITNKFTLLCVGRFVEHKDHKSLIKVVRQLEKSIPNIHLTLVGDGPNKNSIDKLIYSFQMQDIVEILSDISEVMLYDTYMQSDCFVFPSKIDTNGVEGFGIVLLEAMAFKIPIIASDSGGIPEVLDYGNCGLLYKPDNLKCLANAITEVYENINVAKEKATKAYSRLINNYVW